MIAIPAIDLREGACVQLVGGSYAEERVRLPDPLRVAADWSEMGFAWLHVVDLDASLSRGDNSSIVSDILRQSRAKVQVGGGIRTTARVQALIDSGAERIVVGTRAIEDADWLEAIALAYPGRIVVAADVRERSIVTHGWARTPGRDILSFVAGLTGLSLAGLLVTAVHLEGQMVGTDLQLMTDVIGASTCPVTASGGITTIEDLRRLDERKISSAVIGMALYTGALDARPVASEFGS